MPIKIPAELPAYRALDGENIFVMTDERAERQDIRPLEIVIVNLMPTKISTETQLLRLLGNFSPAGQYYPAAYRRACVGSYSGATSGAFLSDF